MPARDYDVVLYGASGFTGRQTVAYFGKHAPPGLRWAIAGRDRDRLDARRNDVRGLGSVDVLVADSGDQASVDAFVSRTRIVLNTAGPFALYGTPVVDACVRFRTHYVDITGETFWVADLVSQYHARAAADGTRIIPGCGFDSVPSDIGALLVVRQMQETLGEEANLEVRSYFQLGGGGLNGGTAATILNRAKTGRLRQSDAPRDLGPPRYDPAIGTWTGPFFMAPINAWVVRRSAAIYAEWRQPYARDFTYREFLKFDPPFAGAKAVAVTAASAVFGAAVQLPPTRRLLAPLLPQPGTGPSEQKMDDGWFSCEVVGIAADAPLAHLKLRHQGDAGNRATVVFVCESALALALNVGALPGPRAGGILTPAAGLGHILVERLRRVGVTFSQSRQAGE
jgi:short subunit dehydrogenase-like uncharacterized protein